MEQRRDRTVLLQKDVAALRVKRALVIDRLNLFREKCDVVGPVAETFLDTVVPEHFTNRVVERLHLARKEIISDRMEPLKYVIVLKRVRLDSPGHYRLASLKLDVPVIGQRVLIPRRTLENLSDLGRGNAADSIGIERIGEVQVCFNQRGPRLTPQLLAAGRVACGSVSSALAFVSSEVEPTTKSVRALVGKSEIELLDRGPGPVVHDARGTRLVADLAVLEKRLERLALRDVLRLGQRGVRRHKLAPNLQDRIDSGEPFVQTLPGLST